MCLTKLTPLFFFIILFSISSCKTQTDKFGGLALYTVRDDMNKNPEATLDSIAQIGFAYVEAAGYEHGKFYNYAPEDFKALLSQKGLVGLSSHHGGITLNTMKEEIAAAKKAGFEYVVVPIPPMGMFTFDQATMTMGMQGEVTELAKILNRIGKEASEQGMKMLYHNHDFEFKPNKDGIIPMVYLLENTDPKYVNFELDLYWIAKAGADPITYFEKYPGRFKMWHVKDMGDNGLFAPVGTGTIDFGQILDKKETSGMVYYFVEQDLTFTNTPLQAIKISHEGLKNIGFD